MDSIRVWRNEQIAVLRQKTEISKSQQKKYYKKHVLPDKKSSRPKNILLAILDESGIIGYGGIVHLDWENRRGEISFLLDPLIMTNKVRYEDVFRKFLKLVELVAFRELDLHRISTETYAFRGKHIQILEDCGFQKEGTLRDNVLDHGKFFNSELHAKIADGE